MLVSEDKLTVPFPGYFSHVALLKLADMRVEWKGRGSVLLVGVRPLSAGPDSYNANHTHLSAVDSQLTMLESQFPYPRSLHLLSPLGNEYDYADQYPGVLAVLLNQNYFLALDCCSFLVFPSSCRIHDS